jgi:hypothetical protein
MDWAAAHRAESDLAEESDADQDGGSGRCCRGGRACCGSSVASIGIQFLDNVERSDLQNAHVLVLHLTELRCQLDNAARRSLID